MFNHKLKKQIKNQLADLEATLRTNAAELDNRVIEFLVKDFGNRIGKRLDRVEMLTGQTALGDSLALVDSLALDLTPSLPRRLDTLDTRVNLVSSQSKDLASQSKTLEARVLELEDADINQDTLIAYTNKVTLELRSYFDGLNTTVNTNYDLLNKRLDTLSHNGFDNNQLVRALTDQMVALTEHLKIEFERDISAGSGSALEEGDSLDWGLTKLIVKKIKPTPKPKSKAVKKPATKKPGASVILGGKKWKVPAAKTRLESTTQAVKKVVAKKKK
jgi:hypothetical protein